MAQPTSLQDIYTAIGLREDLGDVIYNIAPTETPFLTAAGRLKASAIKVEWNADSLDASVTNRAIEGDDAVINTSTPTVRYANQCQISRKVIGVSGTLESVSKAGRKSELAYQIARRAKELKRDMEKSLTTNQQSTVGGSATARSLASVENWITTYGQVGSGEATNTGFVTSTGLVGAVTDTSSAATATEAVLKSVIALVWSQGGQPETIMVGPFNKRIISTQFSGIATQYRDNKGTGQATILAAADNDNHIGNDYALAA